MAGETVLGFQQQPVIAGRVAVIRLNDRSVVSALRRVQQGQRTARILVARCGSRAGSRHVLFVGAKDMVGAVSNVGCGRQPVLADLALITEVPLHHVRVGDMSGEC